MGHLLFWVVGFSSVTPLGLYLELPVNINDQQQRLAYSQRPSEHRLHVNCAERLISGVCISAKQRELFVYVISKMSQ